jgi:hypothetical protein
MKLGRTLTWDANSEQFVGDAAANALAARKPRSLAYDVTRVMRTAGLA